MTSTLVARDFMVTHLVTLPPKLHVLGGMSRLLKHKITGAPVTSDDREYLGVFSEKSCLRVLKATTPGSEPPSRSTADLCARDIMVTRLVALAPERDAYEAIGYLLAHRISGAPVIDAEGTFLGVFSEKTSMSVLVSAAYEQLPTARVSAFMNPDKDRIITEDMRLKDVTQIFLDTPYRRLSVVREGKLIGQISRSDVLRAEHHLAKYVNKSAIEISAHAWEQLCGAARSDEREDRVLAPEVASFMDCDARTITPDTDLLDIARIFLSTPYRRLPVLRDGGLVGQVSRRDLLAARFDQLAIVPPRKKSTLYLSSLVDDDQSPIG